MLKSYLGSTSHSGRDIKTILKDHIHNVCPNNDAHTHTPYKQFNVDNSRCYFLHHVGDEVELIARAVGTDQEMT